MHSTGWVHRALVDVPPVAMATCCPRFSLPLRSHGASQTNTMWPRAMLPLNSVSCDDTEPLRHSQLVHVFFIQNEALAPPYLVMLLGEVDESNGRCAGGDDDDGEMAKEERKR